MDTQSIESRQRLILVDGSGFIFRAYHSLPPLSRADGTPVGAVMGFTNMMLKLRETMKADYLLVIFDAERRNFRHDIYADYKANRPEPPADLIPQFALVREASKAMCIPSTEQLGFEADDLIASYVREAKKAGLETLIISSDKDLMQLIQPGVGMYDSMKNKPIGEKEVFDKFGVEPARVTDVLALIGDTSDHVPGVPGIGPKTAAELIQHFGSLEGLLSRIDEIKQPKRRDMLAQHREAAELSYQLVQLKHDMELPIPISELALKPIDTEAFVAFLREQQFTALLKRYGTLSAEQARASHTVSVSSPEAIAATPPTAEAPLQAFSDAQYDIVDSLQKLDGWIAQAMQAGYVAFDTETTGLDAMQAELVGVSLAIVPGKACYIPIGHCEGSDAPPADSQGGLFDTPQQVQIKRLVNGQLCLEDALRMLKPVLENERILKIGQNIKYDSHIMRRYGVAVKGVADTMLLSYVTAAGLHAHGMDELSEIYLKHTPVSYDTVTGTGKNRKCFSEVGLEIACNYAAEDADITLRLYEHLQPKIAVMQVAEVYERLERPLIPVLVDMEATGIKVAPERLRELSNTFALRMAEREKEIHAMAGESFNIGSPKQLGDILFGKLQLPGGKKSKTGAYATGAEILEELAEAGHDLPRKVLDWRQLSKLKSTYTDALQEQINPNTGRVHTSYSMAVASTGRLSSTDPNLQNIPIRTTEGKLIRHAFVAEEGKKLISADYSQIELRLLAHVADIPSLKEAFRNGADIHTITASQMFGIKPEEVESDLRRKAKMINFGIIYGISAHGLSQRLGISRGEAASYIEAYFAQYPGIRDYMDRMKEFARTHGYVTTLFNRRIHFRDIRSSNPSMRAFSERAAINAPLQGTAADIIKRAMIQSHAMLAQEFPQAKMLLQVHDELVVEAPDAQAETVAKRLRDTMQQAATLSVPLTVDCGIGADWGSI